ncbi:MAG TPA: flagellar type III secretion system pore protein FliP [Chloroflexota bacterium]|nr:flagellar type III secretion system pore protein FliP [Chloroflexota bacterium]
MRIVRGRSALAALGLAGFSLLAGASSAFAQSASINAPGVKVELGGGGTDNGTALQFFLLLTVLSLVPAILMMVTSFVRITIVLSFVRNAIGTQQMPPNQVLVGLALFLSMFVMAPTWQRINTDAVQPYMSNQMSADVAFDRGSQPLREFMFKQVRERDLALFIQVGNLPQPNTQADVPTYVLVPAFMISELKTAFQMGFMVMVPFLVIDIVVSSVLMSMGMMMLPPASISLPFKLLLFVMADGWHLIVRSLVTSFS